MKAIKNIINNVSNKNIKMNETEVELIIDSYFDGLCIINKNNSVGTPFFPEINKSNIDKLKSSAYSFVSQVGKPSYLKNPDLFYLILQYGVLNRFEWKDRELDKYTKLNPKEFVLELLNNSFLEDEISESINKELGLSLSSQIGLSDEQLKSKANQLLSVEDVSLLTDDENIIYTKINHGYWEFLLNSFVSIESTDKYRDLSLSPHPESWKKSGFHAILFDAIRTIADEKDNDDRLKVAVSLSAGDKAYKNTISSDLSAVSRGALVGLLAFIEALGLNNAISLYDGCAPRNMIKNNEFDVFFGSQLDAFDAVLLIVPPGLKCLDFPCYKGKVYTLSIPGQIVHETVRVLIPVILGVLDRLINKHRSVCVITQSAVLAPLAAIYIHKMFGNKSRSISFFDLGRILDISRPELATTVPTLSWVYKSGRHHELSKKIRISESNCNFWLFGLPNNT